MSWQFDSSNAATIKRWSTRDTRDAEKSIFWYPMFFADKAKGLKAQAAGMVSAEKWKGMIRFFTEFQEMDGGDMIRVPHVPKIVGRGTHGDGQLAGNGAPSTILTQDMYLDFFAHQVYSSGPLSDQRVGLKFIDVNREELAKWYTRKWEEAVVLALWGLTTWYGSPLENWNSGSIGETNVFNSTIETYDSEAISYAGDATSDAEIDAGDVLTAQFLSKLRTTIREDRTFPVESMTDDKGQPCFAFVTSGRGIEQLKADEEFRQNHTRVIANADNPLTKRAGYYYDGFYIMEYEKTLRVSQNVGRSLILGADALMMAKHKGIEYFTDPADHAKRKVALSVTGSGALKAHKVAASGTDATMRRRNAHAVDHYVRT